MKSEYIIGIDEVGRGCLAGPVVVAAFAMSLKLKVTSKKLKVRLRDSKKLSPKQREKWFEHIKQQPGVFFCVARGSSKVIDKINISAAANRAAYQALRQVVNSYELKANSCKVYLDGGLYLKNRRYQEENFPNANTIIKGDEKFNVVKLASIVAKFTRDRYMKRLHKKYPNYGFDIHKGYGTKKHYVAIRKHGVSDAHRLTFLGN